ncbi:MAG: YARHG domain-containing protein [Pseudomonadota bacterium]
MTVAIVALSAGAGLGSALAQDDSCYLAGDGICQEAPYGVPAICPILTDTSDCRSAQIAYGSDQWPLDERFLIGRSPEWLRLARNEIFARHGRPFNSADLDTLFRSRDWYQPNTSEPNLSQVERDNVALLSSFEQDPLLPLTQAGWPTPSGSWTAMLEVMGEAPQQVSGYGPHIRLEPASKGDPVSLRRTDDDLVYSWAPEEIDGAAYALGGFVDVPLTVRTLAAYSVSMERGEQTVVDGERVQRFILVGIDEGEEVIFQGTAAVTPDGIVMEAEYGYLFMGCCGDEPEWLEVQYRLSDLERTPLDPSMFVPPLIDYIMAG